jgi:putative transposase
MMSRDVYAEINLHSTWHTKDNSPVLVDAIEHHVRRYLKHRALQTPNVVVYAIGGVADHVHLAVSIPPTLPVSDWIGELKGAAAHYINHEICNKKTLSWQSGYGVVSFGTKDLPWVIRYIKNQRSHHAAESVHDRLERVAHPNEAGAHGEAR